MVDGLDGLRHDAVIGGDHEHDHVGDLGTAGAHGGKGLMARGVDERDLTTVDRNLGGTDVLGDAAGLAAPHVGVADGIEQARLAVVDVSHDGDHGRTRLEVLGIVIEAEGVLLLGRDDTHLATQVVGDELDEVVAHGLRHGERGAQQEQALDDVVGGDVEGLGELGDGHALGDLDGVEVLGIDALSQSLLDLALLGCGCRLGLALLLALLAATGGLAGSLCHGSAGVGQHLLAAVLLRLASHTSVTILAVMGVVHGTLATLLATLAGFLRRGREVVGHIRRGCGTAAAAARRSLRPLIG